MYACHFPYLVHFNTECQVVDDKCSHIVTNCHNHLVFDYAKHYSYPFLFIFKYTFFHLINKILVSQQECILQSRHFYNSSTFCCLFSTHWTWPILALATGNDHHVINLEKILNSFNALIYFYIIFKAKCKHLLVSFPKYND